MTKRIQGLQEKDIGDYLGVIIDFLTSDKKFSELTFYPKYKEINRHIRIKYKVEEDSQEFLDHLKPVLNRCDERYELYQMISRFGKNRGEVIVNLAKAVENSQLLLQCYRDALMERIHCQETGETARGRMTGRDRLGLDATAGNSRYQALQIRNMDMNYLNIFGGRN